jgi:glycosyltransferase involved in cell wall biosynthesis
LNVFLAGTSFLPGYGGPAYSVSRLACALTEAGLRVGVWAPDQSALTTPLLSGRSSVERLSGTASEAMQQFGAVDVIHDNGLWRPHNHRLASIAGARRLPRVVSTRGMLEPWAMNHKRLKKRVAWSLYQRRDLKQASCHHATAAAEAVGVRRLSLGVTVHVIPNGVDVPQDERRNCRAGEAAGPRTALFLGRIYPVKGLPMLIEAWARVRPTGWRLQIAGPDEAGHRAIVEQATAAAGLSDVVSFLGSLDRSAKERALRAADLFVLPTHSESFGMAIGEALAHRRPVLTTTAAPWPMLVDRGCGWWVEPTVDGLADGLRAATSCDRFTLEAMGARGRAFVEAEFAWERVAAQVVAMYESVVSTAAC